MPELVPTIGIECHVQFKTKTKLFSGTDNDERGKGPNTTVSPICFGLPGTLPVLNQKAVEYAVMAGLAMNARIAPASAFDRKHYFYPDLPKGYQITQLYSPIVGRGFIDVPVGGKTLRVNIHHAHLEEDAGKSSHPAGADYSLVDLNRAGTPLLEIVSEADMHSAAEAKAYVQELYLLMKYAGVTHGDLQHGNMRFDVNISVAETGAPLGTRAEIKNLNSFRAVERAVEYEIKRQSEIISKGGKVTQETRGWDEAKQKTTPQRGKEDAQDYRYFPEPDIPPLELGDDFIDKIKAKMPKLPPTLRLELEGMGVSQMAAETLIIQDALTGADYVKTVLKSGKKAAVFSANYLVNREIKLRLESGQAEGPLPAASQFAKVYEMFAAGRLSSNSADQLLASLRGDPQADPQQMAQDQGLLQENNTAALEKIVSQVLQDPASQKAVTDVKSGQEKAIGYLVGQAMKASRGKANPAVLAELIRKQLG